MRGAVSSGNGGVDSSSSAGGVLAVIQRCRLAQTKDVKRVSERADALLESVTEAAEKLTEMTRKLRRTEDEGAAPEMTVVREEKLEALVESTADVVTLKRKMAQFGDAVSTLVRTYAGIEEDAVRGTDFKALLSGYERQVAGTSGRDEFTQRDPEFRAIERKIRRINDSGAMPDDDDEVIVEDPIGGEGLSGVANTACPLTGKSLADIDQPVMDQKGYVYEKEFIIKYIREQRGSCTCPMAGTNHIIRTSDIKVATRVIRAKQRGHLSRMPSRANADVEEIT